MFFYFIQSTLCFIHLKKIQQRIEKKHDLFMSFDEFMIIIRYFVSSRDKSLLGHFEQGLVRVQELISNFHKKSHSSICIEHFCIQSEQNVTFNLVYQLKLPTNQPLHAASVSVVWCCICLVSTYNCTDDVMPL